MKHTCPTGRHPEPCCQCYRHGCRCDGCRAEVARDQRDRMAVKRGGGRPASATRRRVFPLSAIEPLFPVVWVEGRGTPPHVRSLRTTLAEILDHKRADVILDAGALTEREADRVATAIGWHPWCIWPDLWISTALPDPNPETETAA